MGKCVERGLLDPNDRAYDPGVILEAAKKEVTHHSVGHTLLYGQKFKCQSAKVHWSFKLTVDSMWNEEKRRKAGEAWDPKIEIIVFDEHCPELRLQQVRGQQTCLVYVSPMRVHTACNMCGAHACACMW